MNAHQLGEGFCQVAPGSHGGAKRDYERTYASDGEQHRGAKTA
jgi:hypothetical protein